MEQRAIKSDTYTGYGGAAGAMVGNWGALFGTGQRSNGWTELSVGSPGFPAVGNFSMSSPGLHERHGNQYFHIASRLCDEDNDKLLVVQQPRH